MKTRDIAYPEHTDYRDTGCSFHSACLTCPFAVCRYDEDARSLDVERRHTAVREALAGTGNPHLAAQATGLSVRTVYRVLEASRSAHT